MNIKRIFTFFCCVLLSLCMVPAAQAKGMTAAIAVGPVVMNGQAIDNTTAQYPLLVYSNVTYVPMTYHLCRFMGLTTKWDSSTQTLSIDRSSERGPYVPDTGYSRKSGSVSVTRVANPVAVRGVPIDNAVETHPLFLYNGVTYFPLTFDYIVNAFGWTYTWNAASGLNITCLERPEAPSVAVHTGTPALDADLEILNAFYQQNHTYSGTLTDRRNGSVQSFEARTNIELDFYSTDVRLTANPFPFFENGSLVYAQYPRENAMTGEPSFGTGGSDPNFRPGQLPIPPYNSNTEAGYIAMCFLDCQFSGARAQRIRSSSQETQGNVTTWHLNVAFEKNDFTEYHAAVSIDKTRNTVTAIELETTNYVLHMTVKS